MAKRSKEESIGLDDDGAGLEEGTQQSKMEEENGATKSQGRPSRNTRKVVKYTDYEDEFESDFEDEMDFIEEEDEEDSDIEEEEDEESNNDDDEDDDLDLEDEEPESSKKGKKSAAKKKSGTNTLKASKSKKSSKESAAEGDLDSEEEEGEKGSTKAAAKKKKLSAPKNLTKRNVASSGGGSAHGDAGEAIFNYMKEQNRPYSVQNVVDNLHNAYSKKQVTDEMDRLAAEGKFVCKEYGKQKVYLIDQSDCKELNKEEMEALDKTISANESELNDLEARLKQLKQETRNISVPLPIDVLEERIEQESLKVSFYMFWVIKHHMIHVCFFSVTFFCVHSYCRMNHSKKRFRERKSYWMKTARLFLLKS